MPAYMHSCNSFSSVSLGVREGFGTFQPLLIDLDWASEISAARYPPYVNRNGIDRPDDAMNGDNSCAAFVGPYAHLDRSAWYVQTRLENSGSLNFKAPRAVFDITPFPSLCSSRGSGDTLWALRKCRTKGNELKQFLQSFKQTMGLSRCRTMYFVAELTSMPFATRKCCQPICFSCYRSRGANP